MVVKEKTNNIQKKRYSNGNYRLVLRQAEEGVHQTFLASYKDPHYRIDSSGVSTALHDGNVRCRLTAIKGGLLREEINTYYICLEGIQHGRVNFKREFKASDTDAANLEILEHKGRDMFIAIADICSDQLAKFFHEKSFCNGNEKVGSLIAFSDLVYLRYGLKNAEFVPNDKHIAFLRYLHSK